MGFWGTKLFSNDTTCDVRDSYEHLLILYKDFDVVQNKIKREFSELINTEEECLFWYALAYMQCINGCLSDEVRKKAIYWIEQKKTTFFERNSKEEREWDDTLYTLKNQIGNAAFKEIKITTHENYVTNPWKVGDVYAYKFHSIRSKSVGFFGKYIIFQKIGEVEYYEGVNYSAVKVFNKLFNEIPNLEEALKHNTLPLINPPGVGGTPNRLEDYVPALEWYMRATMIIEKKSDYPGNKFYFVGHSDVARAKFEGNQLSDFYCKKTDMEPWLIEYYLNWQSHSLT